MTWNDPESGHGSCRTYLRSWCTLVPRLAKVSHQTIFPLLALELRHELIEDDIHRLVPSTLHGSSSIRSPGQAHHQARSITTHSEKTEEQVKHRARARLEGRDREIESGKSSRRRPIARRSTNTYADAKCNPTKWVPLHFTCFPPPIFSHMVFATDLGCAAWITKFTGIT